MGGSPLTAARLQRAAHPEQPIDQHKMRQDQGRAWRGACKTFATLAAEIRICVNVSTASKTRMKDLTTACRESSHSFPRPHRLELESQHHAVQLFLVPARTWASALRALNVSEGAGSHSGSQPVSVAMQDQEAGVSSPAPHNLCLVLEGLRKSLPQKSHKNTACAKQRHSPASEGRSPCGTPVTQGR